MYQRVGQQAFKKDLTNITELCNWLGNPERQFNSVHIAGTNGKGSTAHILAATLQANGYKVGLYTSPHYIDFRERIKINGELIPESFVIDFVNQVKQELTDIQPSFFEITVAMAFSYFAKADVDVAIIETGLGGRLDSTNIINPLISVITNIGLDHQNMLGETLPEIAGEKAGIIKPQTPIVIGERQSKSISEVFIRQAEKENAPLFFAEDITLNLHKEFSLIGDYQLKNKRTALAALSLLPEFGFDIDSKNTAKGLKQVTELTYFMGRMQVIQENPTVLLDSAHNQDGIKVLNKQIQQIPFNELHFVYGTVNDKDYSKILQLLPLNANYYLCRPNIPRGAAVEDVSREAEKLALSTQQYESVEQAYRAAIQTANTDDLIVVAGSIFVVAEVLGLVK